MKRKRRRRWERGRQLDFGLGGIIPELKSDLSEDSGGFYAVFFLGLFLVSYLSIHCLHNASTIAVFAYGK